MVKISICNTKRYQREECVRGNPKLQRLEPNIEKEEDIFITDKEYLEGTGVALPKGKSYLRNRSALSA